MDTLFTNFVEETNCMRTEEDEEAGNKEDNEKDKGKTKPVWFRPHSYESLTFISFR